jgi:hypothetical protein
MRSCSCRLPLPYVALFGLDLILDGSRACKLDFFEASGLSRFSILRYRIFYFLLDLESLL